MISMTNSRFMKRLDQRPNLDTDAAHAGVGEFSREALQRLRNLAPLGCGEWGVGDLHGVGLENEVNK